MKKTLIAFLYGVNSFLVFNIQQNNFSVFVRVKKVKIKLYTDVTIVFLYFCLLLL